MLPEGTFDGKVAIITGGGSGIGRAIGIELARLGAAVGLVGRRSDVLDAAVVEIETVGGSALALPGDVRDRASVDQSVCELRDRFGPADLLVNAAAGNFRVAPEDMSPRAWDAVVRIVLDGTWQWTQAIGRAAIADTRPAAILNIGTVGALQGGPATVHSASAKAGVVAMTKSLAAAWGPHGIRVNLLTPGITAGTPGADILWADDADRARTTADVPLRRAGTLDEVSAAATYLLSDYASYVTGANLLIDGGRALGRA